MTGGPWSERELVLIADQALLPGEQSLQPAVVRVDTITGKIIDIRSNTAELPVSISSHVVRLDKGQILLPGLIDCHVHLNQPGRTAWEGFETGTAAAVGGGVTTLIDMPLNSIPPTTTVANLNVKREEAKKVGVRCDVGFWGGIIPGNEDDLVPLLREGVKGFKCFLINSGVEEFPHVEEHDLEIACERLRDTNALILFHAELETRAHEHPDQIASDGSCYSSFLNSRPVSLELSALHLILGFCRRYPGLRFHIVHLSAADALPVIREARASGVANLTVETCFHYLCLRAEDIPPNATQYKCCPPIREEANRQKIVQAVLDGDIDFVVSDHSPCTPELKKGDFMSAWGGISGLGLGLTLMWTEIGKSAGLHKIVDLLSTRQAAQVGLDKSKGRLQAGYDADFVVFDPEAEIEVTKDVLRFKNKVSPYLGRKLHGKVMQTYVGGRLAFDDKAGLVDNTAGLV